MASVVIIWFRLGVKNSVILGLKEMFAVLAIADFKMVRNAVMLMRSVAATALMPVAVQFVGVSLALLFPAKNPQCASTC